MGRLAGIQYLGGYIITIPETPGSEPTDHQTSKAWNLSNPANPVSVQPVNPNSNGGHFGQTGNPILAHGSYSRGNEVYIAGNGNNGNPGLPSWQQRDTVRLNANGSLEHVVWSGPPAPALVDRNGNPVYVPQGWQDSAHWWTKGSMMRPWSLGDNWAYNSNPVNTTRLTLRNVLMAEWDVVAETGVAGFGNFIGNLLIYASDQRANGVAAYDATDIYFDAATNEWKPRLLDVLNTPASEGGIGGYWSEISGHYLVVARQQDSAVPNSFAGVQVVDFSDPTNLRLHCEVELSNPEQNRHWTLNADPMYVGLQDEYAFVDNFKVDIRTCEVALRLDISQGQRGSLCYSGSDCPNRVINTSQYSRVVGNLWITGGYPTKANIDGMGVWVHQSAPDTRAPYIAYHVPAANQVNYPVDAPLGFSIPETLEPTSIVTSVMRQSGQTDSVTLAAVDGSPVAIDYILSHQGMLTINPVNGLAPDTTYEVAFTSGIRDAVGNPMTPYTFRFSTGDSIDGGGGTDPDPSPAVIDNVSVTPGARVDIDSNVTVTVQSGNATSYRLALDGESAPWQAGNSRTLSFDTAGSFFLNVRARNADGDSPVRRIELTVVDSTQLTGPPGPHSSQLVCDEDNGRVWAVNPDNRSMAVLDADSMEKLKELRKPRDPRGVAMIGNSQVWVTSPDNDRIYPYDRATLRAKRAVRADYGSAPDQVLGSPDGLWAYVTFYNAGRIGRYPLDGKAADAEFIELAPTVSAMALTPDGSRLLVARRISPENWGEVYEIDTASWTLARTYRLHKHLANDALDEGRGKPNYLTAILVNGAGDRAYVIGKKDNTDRGLLNGLGLDLDDDNTVRTIGMTLDLENGMELRDQRIDFDNTSSLSALTMSDDGRFLYIAEQGKNSVLAMEIGADRRFTGLTYSYAVGLAPQGLCFDGSRQKLFAKNFTDRSVTAMDLNSNLASPAKQTASTVKREKMKARVLAGLQLFYNAFDGLNDSTPVGNMSAEGYISCASCHLDGGEDGNTWDFTGRGEGLRNNISLNGRRGTKFGNVHWSGNFDEIQDFEHDIRTAFNGRGLMSAEEFAQADTPLGAPKKGLSESLDALAAYVESLGRASQPRSPWRKTAGGFTREAARGRKHFRTQGCGTCHRGRNLSDSEIHDVGTLRTSSGQRLGEELPGIKTPPIRGLFLTAPYLHDGSARSLEAVFHTVGGVNWQLDDDATTWNTNGDIVIQEDYSYLRGAGGMRLVGNDATGGALNDYARGVAGPGKIRVRYGSSMDGGELDILVDDSLQGSIDLQVLPLVDGVDANFTGSESLDVVLPDGAHDIAFRYRGTGSVIIDEFTVSNAEDLARAEPHLRAAELAPEAFAELMDYLRQLDRKGAP